MEALSKPVYSPGPFASLIKVENALLPTGERRTATITAAPDTFFSVPARISYEGKKVGGFLSMQDEEWTFTPTGKHRGAFDKALGVLRCPNIPHNSYCPPTVTVKVGDLVFAPYPNLPHGFGRVLSHSNLPGWDACMSGYNPDMKREARIMVLSPLTDMRSAMIRFIRAEEVTGISVPFQPDFNPAGSFLATMRLLFAQDLPPAEQVKAMSEYGSLSDAYVTQALSRYAEGKLAPGEGAP